MFTDQNTIELKRDDHLLNSNLAAWQRPVCAWCLSEQGIAAGEGSHGICTTHAEWLLKQWRERNRHRHQGLKHSA